MRGELVAAAGRLRDIIPALIGGDGHRCGVSSGGGVKGFWPLPFVIWGQNKSSCLTSALHTRYTIIRGVRL